MIDCKHWGSRSIVNNSNDLFVKFKALADRKKSVYDEDIEALVLGTEQSGPWHLDAISIHTEVENTDQSAEASLKLRFDGQAPRIYTGRGDGPVNAIVNAIRAIINEELRMEEFQVDALSRAAVTPRDGPRCALRSAPAVTRERRRLHGYR